MNDNLTSLHATRRAFLQRAGLTAGSVLGGCAATTPAAEAKTEPEAPLDVAAAKMPYRQDDPAWGADLMWDRDLVMKADRDLNGASLAETRSLLREFDDGNSIGNEGCQLTCLAMVLRLLAPHPQPTWTPATINASAQDRYYYTRCGLSMTTLYADLIAEMTSGDVQLCLKEESLSGELGWPCLFANTSALVRVSLVDARAAQ